MLYLKNLTVFLQDDWLLLTLYFTMTSISYEFIVFIKYLISEIVVKIVNRDVDFGFI